MYSNDYLNAYKTIHERVLGRLGTARTASISFRGHACFVTRQCFGVFGDGALVWFLVYRVLAAQLFPIYRARSSRRVSYY